MWGGVVSIGNRFQLKPEMIRLLMVILFCINTPKTQTTSIVSHFTIFVNTKITFLRLSLKNVNIYAYLVIKTNEKAPTALQSGLF